MKRSIKQQRQLSRQIEAFRLQRRLGEAAEKSAAAFAKGAEQAQRKIAKLQSPNLASRIGTRAAVNLASGDASRYKRALAYAKAEAKEANRRAAAAERRVMELKRQLAAAGYKPRGQLEGRVRAGTSIEKLLIAETARRLVANKRLTDRQRAVVGIRNDDLARSAFFGASPRAVRRVLTMMAKEKHPKGGYKSKLMSVAAEAARLIAQGNRRQANDLLTNPANMSKADAKVFYRSAGLGGLDNNDAELVWRAAERYAADYDPPSPIKDAVYNKREMEAIEHDNTSARAVRATVAAEADPEQYNRIIARLPWLESNDGGRSYPRTKNFP